MVERLTVNEDVAGSCPAPGAFFFFSLLVPPALSNISPVMKDKYYLKTIPCVHVGRGEWVPTDKVEFVDLSEDPQGYDLMTFIYEGKEMQSRVASQPVY